MKNSILSIVLAISVICLMGCNSAPNAPETVKDPLIGTWETSYAISDSITGVLDLTFEECSRYSIRYSVQWGATVYAQDSSSGEYSVVDNQLIRVPVGGTRIAQDYTLSNDTLTINSIAWVYKGAN